MKDRGLASSREVLPDILASEDAEEGLRSFIERRKGDFTGRQAFTKEAGP